MFELLAFDEISRTQVFWNYIAEVDSLGNVRSDTLAVESVASEIVVAPNLLLFPRPTTTPNDAVEASLEDKFVPGDFDGDGDHDIDDYNASGAALGLCAADANRDSIVDFGDLLIVINDWGTTCE